MSRAGAAASYLTWLIAFLGLCVLVAVLPDRVDVGVRLSGGDLAFWLAIPAYLAQPFFSGLLARLFDGSDDFARAHAQAATNFHKTFSGPATALCLFFTACLITVVLAALIGPLLAAVLLVWCGVWWLLSLVLAVRALLGFPPPRRLAD